METHVSGSVCDQASSSPFESVHVHAEQTGCQASVDLRALDNFTGKELTDLPATAQIDSDPLDPIKLPNPPVSSSARATAKPQAIAPKRRRHRAAKAMSTLSMVFVSLAITYPVFAQMTTTHAVNQTTPAASTGMQSYTADGPIGSTTSRGEYMAHSAAEAAAEAITPRDDTFVNEPQADVQWPFLHGVPFTDGFGYRTGAFAGMHTGQDFAAGNGMPVRAIAAGTVTSTSFIPGADGQHVKIEHIIDGKKIVSVYAHMQFGSQTVEVGDSVTVGQVVGFVGSTGASSGPHLHLEVVIDGNFVDPVTFLIEQNSRKPAA